MKLESEPPETPLNNAEPPGKQLRRLGQLLAVLGLLVGFAAALAIALPIHITGISWLIAVGLVKLTFAASLGLIGGGAVLQRLAKRSEERARLSAPREP